MSALAESASSGVDEVQAETGLLGEVTAQQLRFVIEEISHQIHHLERSNAELQVELEQAYDADYAEAVSENMVVMQRMKSQVKRYLEVLRQIDPAYAVEHAEALTLLFDNLALANVDANADSTISADVNASSNRGGGVIEIVMGNQRQVDAEQRILTGTGEAGVGGAGVPQPEARPDIEVKAQPEDDDGSGGLYL